MALIDNLKDIFKKSKTQYPDNIKTRKGKIAYWCFKNWYIISQGRGSVIGRFTNLLPEMAVIIGVLKLWFGWPVTPGWVALYILVFHVISWIIGYYWLRFNMDRVDMQVSSERNPITMEIHKTVVKKNKREVF